MREMSVLYVCEQQVPQVRNTLVAVMSSIICQFFVPVPLVRHSVLPSPRDVAIAFTHDKPTTNTTRHQNPHLAAPTSADLPTTTFHLAARTRIHDT
jgi:hypothetical protein